MLYLFIFVAFVAINIFIYSQFGVPGLLILHTAIFTTLLIMIYDKLTNVFTKKKKTEKNDGEEEARRIKEYELSKHVFQERDLPSPNEIKDHDPK